MFTVMPTDLQLTSGAIATGVDLLGMHVPGAWRGLPAMPHNDRRLLLRLRGGAHSQTPPGGVLHLSPSGK